MTTHRAVALNALNFEIHIDCLCRDRYLRNNKRGGLKHLRCFPECLPSGHHASGFCGHHISAFTLSDTFLPEDTVVIARFSTAENSLPNESALPLTVGVEVKRSDVSDRLRTREEPIREFVDGIKVSETRRSDRERIKSQYKFIPSAWHYGWRSSKHTKDQLHRMYLYLLVPAPSDPRRLLCVAKTETTKFKLSSSKRARYGREPQKQHLVVTPEEAVACLEDQHSKPVVKRQRMRPSKTSSQSQSCRPQMGELKMEFVDYSPFVGDDNDIEWSNLTLPSDSEHDDDDYDFSASTERSESKRDEATILEDLSCRIPDPLNSQEDDALLEYSGWPNKTKIEAAGTQLLAKTSGEPGGMMNRPSTLFFG